MEEFIAGREYVPDRKVIRCAKSTRLGSGDKVIIPILLDRIEIVAFCDNDLVARKSDYENWLVDTFYDINDDLQDLPLSTIKRTPPTNAKT